MVDTKIKTKAAMLHELESIKGLLLEADDIPILQEVIEAQAPPTAETVNSASETELAARTAAQIIIEEQQDFFDSHRNALANKTHHADSDSELLNTIDELEKHTHEVTANKFANDLNKGAARHSLAKATGENPFLPAHIRSRLHGNNPPPLFAQETARKIAGTSVPSRLLGNTSIFTATVKTTTQQDILDGIIDSIIEKIMPDIEQELRERLALMSKHLLDELNK
jgi:hypothetical protein